MKHPYRQNSSSGCNGLALPWHNNCRRILLLLLIEVAGAACGDLAGNATLPAGSQDPNTYNTSVGALATYRGVKADFQAMRDIIGESGALTDELTAPNLGNGPASIGATGDPLDGRVLGSAIGGSTNSYGGLQHVRGTAMEAIGLLTSYAPDSSPALRGEVYALEGYAELLLAELYCSGVPLSTLDFQGDFTYKPSSTSTAVYQHALALFDSALAIASDSPSVMLFTRVAKGRALLDLDSAAQAAQVVTSVPDTFHYAIPVVWNQSSPFEGYSVSNGEGVHGLPFATANDPRAPVVPAGTNDFGVPLFTPAVYPEGTMTPVVLASGVEARLIQAEAALRANPASLHWLTILNTLRTSGTGTPIPAQTLIDTLGVTQCGGSFGGTCGNGPGSDTSSGKPNNFPGAGYTLVSADTTFPAPAGVGGSGGLCDQRSWYEPCYAGDTMVVLTYVRPASTHWDAGTGGVSGLAPLADPGATLNGTAASNARVDLLFHERAYWLFLTGHRQGDLRRLVRNYGRRQQDVYPTGPYFGGLGSYGSDVEFPIPTGELSNPLFHGCLSRGA